MNTKLLAALLFSSAVIATPAFAGNAHVGDDVNARAATSTPSTLTRAQVRADLIQSSQVASRDSNQETTYPVLAQDNSGASRAQVRADLVQSEQVAGRTGNEETTYPVLGQSNVAVSRAAVKQGLNVASNSKNNIFAFGHDAS
jgi:hypothetical protein